MKQRLPFRFLLAVLLAVSMNAFAVTQIGSGTARISKADYTVTGSNPFAADGIANLTTDVATLILTKIKPSVAIGMLADHVRINGEVAQSGVNCQVKIYSQGCIILPYGDSFKPLTVYSEPNFGGDECNDFGLEDSGGFMNTLSDEKLNNRIRSFKLKRGYMVTFSLRSGGYGYSRCFIAADKDLEMAELPAVMDQKISSYRIFKWFDVSKKGLADAAHDRAACNALNVTTTYAWYRGQDAALLPDVECVPHHYKESWPSAGECGGVTTSAHLKMNNEPLNQSDEEPCSLNDILNNWEQFMRTGHRLCSPSSWDGSDYIVEENGRKVAGGNLLRLFFDEIDKRGWRCDIIDLHCYWDKGKFSSDLPVWNNTWLNSLKRPIWVTEWVWGASWGNDGKGTGAFASGVTESQNKAAVQDICGRMNNMDYVERYYFWNVERDPSRVYRDGSLTEAGNYYASLDPGLAYKGTDYVPAAPPQKDPSGLTTVFVAGNTSLRWYDSNGELNRSMSVEYRASSGSSWQEVTTVEQKETASNYTVEAANGEGQYRIHVVDLNGEDRYSDVVSVSEATSLYLYNIGSQQWLCTGNAWGSHASLTSNGGVDVLLEKASDGKYTINTQLVNGNNHYLNMLDNGPWMDQTAGEWTVTENGDGTCLLTCNGGNLAYDGSSLSLIKSSDTGPNAQWRFLTRADRIAQLADASPENPVDATFFIIDNDFARYNDLRRSVWQGSPHFDGFANGESSNFCVERFNMTYDVYQTITDAPAGNYRLMVQGFYRDGGYKDAASKHNGGSESLNALLYANEATQPLQSIFTEAGKLEIGATTSDINGHFPNSQSDGAHYFSSGYYDDNVLEFTLEEGEELRLGIKKTVATANDWTIFDNFRLIYLGQPPVPNDLTGDSKVDANDVRALISHLLGNTPDGFDTEAADINGDGDVDIRDVTKLIDIILNDPQTSLSASPRQTTSEAYSNRTKK